MFEIRKLTPYNWAFWDQCIVSGVNFITGIILARYLGPAEYGYFTLVWSIILFFGAIQLALIINPMLTIAPKQEKNFAKCYFQSLLTQQVYLSLICLIIVIFICMIIHIVTPQNNILIGSALLATTTFVLMMRDFLRKYLYANKKYISALYTDIIAHLGQLLTLLIVVNYFVKLNFNYVLLAILIPSTLSLINGIKYLPKFKKDINYQVIKRNWYFSKWMGATVVLQWLSGHIFFFVSGLIVGVSSVGVMRAAHNIMGIMNIVFQALENIIPINASNKLHILGPIRLKEYMYKVIILGLILNALILILVSYDPNSIMSIFYGNKYNDYGDLLIICAFIYASVFISLVLRMWLRTLEQPKEIFVSYWWMVSVGCIIVYPIIINYGVHGAMIGILITNIIIIVRLVIGLMRFRCA